MATVRRTGDLEIDEDLRFQRREWKAQRVAWVALGLLILGALAGALGAPGPLASTSVRAGPAVLRLDRIARARTPTVLRLQAERSSGPLRVWISRDYVDAVRVERIVPTPVRTAAGPDRVTYDLVVTDGPLDIAITLAPLSPGLLRGSLGLGDGVALRFRQLVLP